MLDEILKSLAAQPALLALIALVLDRAWPRHSARPPAAVAQAIGHLAGRLDRQGRSETTRRVRGSLLWLWCVGAALIVGVVLTRGLREVLPVEAAMLVEAGVLAVAGGFSAARAAARRAVEGVGRLSRAEAVPVARTACDRLAWRFAAGPVALALAWLIGGLPALFVLKAGTWCVQVVEGPGPFARAVRACQAGLSLPASLSAAVLIGFGRLPARVDAPAEAALASSLARRGFDEAAPGERIAAALVLVDRAHALWLLLLFAAVVATDLL